MTTTTDTQPLQAGDLVTYQGHKASLHTPLDSGLVESYWAVRFDDGEAYRGSWDGEARGYGTGQFYYVHKNDDELTRPASPSPYVPSLGDRANLTRNGVTATGTVYALQHEDRADTPVRYVWVSTDDTYDYPYADFIRTSSYSHRVAVPHEDAPEGLRGHWFDLRDYTVSPAEPVGITSATPEGTPSEAAQVPAESPEATALKAQVEAAETRARMLQQEVNAMRSDLTIIGEHLKATAERHEWCGEYEEHLERLLGALSGYSDDYLREAAERVREFTVTYTYTTTVEAPDAYTAREYASELYSTGNLDGTWETED
jgi:hypothetical protein